MMKKLFLILVGVGITMAAFAGAGAVFAEDSMPPIEANSQGSYGFGRRGGRFGEMEDSPLHDLMTAAIADAFGLTVEELETMHENGETLWTLAEEQGLTTEEFQVKMLEARQDAVQQAVDEGLISQEVADQMLSRWENTPMGGKVSARQGMRGRHNSQRGNGCRDDG